MKDVDVIFSVARAFAGGGIGALPLPSELLDDEDSVRVRRQAAEDRRRVLEADERRRRAAYMKQQEETKPTRSAIRSREIRKRQKGK